MRWPGHVTIVVSLLRIMKPALFRARVIITRNTITTTVSAKSLLSATYVVGGFGLRSAVIAANQHCVDSAQEMRTFEDALTYIRWAWPYSLPQTVSDAAFAEWLVEHHRDFELPICFKSPESLSDSDYAALNAALAAYVATTTSGMAEIERIRKMDISAELERIGADCDDVGPVESLAVEERGNAVRIYDDRAVAILLRSEWLQLLATIPDDCDLQEDFWGTPEIQDAPQAWGIFAQKHWNEDHETFRILDENGGNPGDARAQQLDAETWIYVDEADGYTVLENFEVDTIQDDLVSERDWFDPEQGYGCEKGL